MKAADRGTAGPVGGPSYVTAVGEITELLVTPVGAEAQSVRDCVQALDGGQKQAIALAFFQGLTHAELCRSLGVPSSTCSGVSLERFAE